MLSLKFNLRLLDNGLYLNVPYQLSNFFFHQPTSPTNIIGQVACGLVGHLREETLSLEVKLSNVAKKYCDMLLDKFNLKNPKGIIKILSPSLEMLLIRAYRGR